LGQFGSHFLTVSHTFALLRSLVRARCPFLALESSQKRRSVPSLLQFSGQNSVEDDRSSQDGPVITGGSHWRNNRVDRDDVGRVQRDQSTPPIDFLGSAEKWDVTGAGHR
jgi:hypothetical protein